MKILYSLTHALTILALSLVLISLGNSLHSLYPQTLPSYFPSHIDRPWPSLLPSPQPSPLPSPESSPLPTAKPQLQSTQITSAPISEDSLWQALVVYRHTHNRTSLVKEEALCAYARKRVLQHQDRLKNLGAGESPLDNHSGFQADADSKALFSETGFNSVAEVLAFLPNAQNATQVIEWGWDSSPSHREGLLNNDMTHACIVGSTPFFVGILAAR